MTNIDTLIANLDTLITNPDLRKSNLYTWIKNP